MSLGPIGQSLRVAAALAAGALRSIAAAIYRGLSGLGLFNWIRRKWGPLNSTEASQLYNLGKKAVAAGVQQTALGQSGVLPNSLIPSAPDAFALWPANTKFAYDVRLGWIDPSTQEQRWLSVWITEENENSNAGLFQEAVEAVDWSNYEAALGTQSPTDPSSLVNSFVVNMVVQR